MSRKTIIVSLIGGCLAIAAVAGSIFTFRTVSAQAPTTTPAAPSTQPGRKGGDRGGYTEDQLAAALGITLEKLQAAEQTATSEALKQAVADGTITQSQADQYAQNARNGRPWDGRMFLHDSNIDYNTLLAQALGISTDELQSARQKALTAALDQAVADGTLTQEQADAQKARSALSASTKFQDAMKSAFTAAVNQAVSDGLITQAQADALLNSSTGTGKWGGFGGLDGFGGHGGSHGGRGGFGQNDGNAPTLAPSTSGM